KHQKPIINNFMAGRIVKEAIHLLEEVNMVNLATGERGAFVLSKLTERVKIQERIQFASID
ncbi:MAG: hypothetical protein WA915_16055, partial [Candidatus Aminicenantaceae bacterium]